MVVINFVVVTGDSVTTRGGCTRVTTRGSFASGKGAGSRGGTDECDRGSSTPLIDCCRETDGDFVTMLIGTKGSR